MHYCDVIELCRGRWTTAAVHLGHGACQIAVQPLAAVAAADLVVLISSAFSRGGARLLPNAVVAGVAGCGRAVQSVHFVSGTSGQAVPRVGWALHWHGSLFFSYCGLLLARSPFAFVTAAPPPTLASSSSCPCILVLPRPPVLASWSFRPCIFILPPRLTPPVSPSDSLARSRPRSLSFALVRSRSV
jgi:hypothetical protein